jgi:hypothetical protein
MARPRLQDVTTLMFAVADGLATFDFYESDVNQFDVSHSPYTLRQTLHPKPPQKNETRKTKSETIPAPSKRGHSPPATQTSLPKHHGNSGCLSNLKLKPETRTRNPKPEARNPLDF